MEVKGGSGSFSSTVDTPGVLNMSAGDTSPILVSLRVVGGGGLGAPQPS